MNGFDYLVNLGARADVLLCTASIAVLTVTIAICERIRKVRKARDAKTQHSETEADFCTGDDYPVPASIKDSAGTEGVE